MATVPGITSCHNPIEQKLASCLHQIESYHADFKIYNNGSATTGLYNGGVAAIIITRPPETPTVVKDLDLFGRKFIS